MAPLQCADSIPSFHQGEDLISSLFFLFGFGVVVPWHIMYIAQGYFHSRFSSSSSWWIRDNFEAIFSLAIHAPSALTFLAILIRNNRLPLREILRLDQDDATTNTRNSNNPKALLSKLGVIIAFSTSLFFLLLHTVFVRIQSIPSDGLFWFSVVSLVFFGISHSVSNDELFSHAQIYPSRVGISGSFLMSQNMVGLFIAFLNFVLVYFDNEAEQRFWDRRCDGTDTTQDTSSKYMFTLLLSASIKICLSILAFVYLKNMPMTRFFQEQRFRNLEVASASIRNERRYHREKSASKVIEEECVFTDDHDYHKSMLLKSLLEDTPVATPSNNSPFVPPISKSIRSLSSALCLSQFCTICIFPGWVGTLTSTHQCVTTNQDRIFNDLFIPLLFLLYNISEFLGRQVTPIFLPKDISGNSLLGATTLRAIVFLPLFLLCDHTEGDVFTMVLLCLLGFSSGSAVTLCCNRAKQISDNEVSTTMMDLGHNMGLLLGSFVSVFYVGFLGN